MFPKALGLGHDDGATPNPQHLRRPSLNLHQAYHHHHPHHHHHRSSSSSSSQEEKYPLLHPANEETIECHDHSHNNNNHISDETRACLSHASYLLSGTAVTEGEGVMWVAAIGKQTPYGNMAIDLGSSESRDPPLKEKLSHLADLIAKCSYIGAVFIALSFLLKQVFANNDYSLTHIAQYFANWPVALHDVFTSFILAVIIVVVAVPEGLPMMIAIVLSMNMRKLLDRNVLVRSVGDGGGGYNGG